MLPFFFSLSWGMNNESAEDPSGKRAKDDQPEFNRGKKKKKTWWLRLDENDPTFRHVYMYFSFQQKPTLWLFLFLFFSKMTHVYMYLYLYLWQILNYLFSTILLIFYFISFSLYIYVYMCVLFYLSEGLKMDESTFYISYISLPSHTSQRI